MFVPLNDAVDGRGIPRSTARLQPHDAIRGVHRREQVSVFHPEAIAALTGLEANRPPPILSCRPPMAPVLLVADEGPRTGRRDGHCRKARPACHYCKVARTTRNSRGRQRRGCRVPGRARTEGHRRSISDGEQGELLRCRSPRRRGFPARIVERALKPLDVCESCTSERPFRLVRIGACPLQILVTQKALPPSTRRNADPSAHGSRRSVRGESARAAPRRRRHSRAIRVARTLRCHGDASAGECYLGT